SASGAVKAPTPLRPTTPLPLRVAGAIVRSPVPVISPAASLTLPVAASVADGADKLPEPTTPRVPTPDNVAAAADTAPEPATPRTPEPDIVAAPAVSPPVPVISSAEDPISS